MKSWDDVLKEETGKALDQRIFAAAQKELESNRVRERRGFWTWLAAPVALGVAGVVSWRVLSTRSAKDAEVSPELMLLTEIDHEMNGLAEADGAFDLLADLEILEDLETLEKWTTNS